MGDRGRVGVVGDVGGAVDREAVDIDVAGELVLAGEAGLLMVVVLVVPATKEGSEVPAGRPVGGDRGGAGGGGCGGGASGGGG